ncbi:hypothetical protein ACJX0J_017734, partial [Zea mays]
MNLGVVLSYFDARFHGNALDIRYQFIPQMIFLNSLFSYLALLILIKWCTGSQADLYHVMIYMFLDPAGDLGENQLFWGQKKLQILLLPLALVVVPCMLFPKPFILKRLHKERFQGHTYRFLGTSEMDPDSEPDSNRTRHDDFNFSEVFVYQMIHSIEFVLGVVSNTASYLRLWALSLAHSELSTVFYEKLLLLAWGAHDGNTEDWFISYNFLEHRWAFPDTQHFQYTFSSNGDIARKGIQDILLFASLSLFPYGL